MSTLIAGHMLMASASAFYSLYRIIKPFRIGIYGPSKTGKTTLDQYLTVPGDIESIPDLFRTSHHKNNSVVGYEMPRATRKQIKWKHEKKSVISSDIAGQSQFKNMWVEDMFARDVEVVVYMIDDRVLNSPQFLVEAVAGFEYLVNNITKKEISKQISRKARKKVKKYRPKVICLMINKMDNWWDEEARQLHHYGLLREHRIVTHFRNGLKRLRKAGFRAEVHPVSAQRGINVEDTFIHLIDSM